MADSNSEGMGSGTESLGSAGDEFSGLIEDANAHIMDGAGPDEMLDLLNKEVEKEAEEEEEVLDEGETSDPEEDEAEDDAEEEGEEEEDEEEVGEEEAKPVKGANKRIQQLVTQRKELENQLAQTKSQFESYAQQAQAQFQQFQQQRDARQNEMLMEMANANKLMQKQIEMLTGRKQAEEEAGLSEVERFKRDTQKAAEEQALAHVRALEEKWEKAEAERQAQAQQAQTQYQIRQLSQDVQNARNTIYFEGFDLTKIDPEHGKVIDDTIMALVAARDVTPQQAAEYLRKTNTFMATEQQKRAVATVSKKKKRAQSTKLPSGGSKQAAKSDSRPAWPLIRKHGYSSYVAWRADGSPHLE